MTGWQDRAACTDTDVDFFPPNNDVTPALVVCATCPVRRPCLNYAIANREEHGVWGGRNFGYRAR